MNMDRDLNDVIDSIVEEYADFVEKGARHYLEVNVGERAEKLGYNQLKDAYLKTYVIVPLSMPRDGMKVRVDGRTFVNYMEHSSGIAMPGYLARKAGRGYRTFIPNDSMICNYT